MIRQFSSIPRTYDVAPSETYVCKYCGARVALGQFIFHRCR